MAHATDLIVNPLKDQNAYSVQFVSPQITDSYAISKIHEQLMELAKKSTGPRILLDFSNVKHLSSEALGKLLTLHKTASESGGSVSLAGLDDPNIRSVFKITQLDKVFSVYPTIKDAEDAL